MAAITHECAKYIESLATGLSNPGADSFGVILMDTFTPGTLYTTGQFVADFLAAGTETTGTGYTAGGQTLSTVTWTQSGAVWTLDAADPSWTAATIHPAWALWFDATPGTNATNPVVGVWDLNGAAGVTADTYTLNINASGLWFYTAAI